MQGIVVGVLRGGPSREHEVSLRTGHAIMAALPPERYSVRDVYIDKEGMWHERGRPTSADSVLSTVDVVVPGLHGEFGEDGTVQKLLERRGVPFTGAGSFGAFLSMHKALAKERAREAGLTTPRYRLVETPEEAETAALEAVRSMSQPVVVKPLRWGSSVGVSMPAGFLPIYNAVADLFAEGAGGVLIEERIRGTEATVGVVEGLRGEELYALPPVEIIPHESDAFFTYDAKYSGRTREVCPGRFSRSAQEELAQAARAAHRALGLRHYSRSDFIVTPRGVYYLETNALPGLTPRSLMPRALSAVGVAFSDFLSHIIDRALGRA